MANGFLGSKDEWDRLEAPLIQIDPILESAATKFDLVLRKNHKDPERSLIRESNIRYLLQIFLCDEKDPKYNVWICASEDRSSGRYWKEEMVLQHAAIDLITEDLIDQSLHALLSWDKSDLVPTRS